MASSANDIQQQWKKENKKVQPVLQQLQQKLDQQQSSAPTERTLAVNQLDAQILDKELFDILRAQFLRIFSFFKSPSNEWEVVHNFGVISGQQEDFVDRFHPELDAFLQFIVYRISIWAQGERSYGQQLQNLKFAPLSLRQKLLYFLLTVGVPYAMKRWQAVYSWYHKLDDAPPMDVVRAVHRLERIYQVISVINFWFFLWNGQFVSVAHRLLNIKQTYIRTQMARKVSFEYMNRQLIWNGFTEFMIFIMPMVSFNRVGKAMNTIIYTTARKLGWATADPMQNLSNSTCPICLSTVTTPYRASCGDTFCYYCLKVAMMTDGTPSCPKCTNSITHMDRVQS